MTEQSYESPRILLVWGYGDFEHAEKDNALEVYISLLLGKNGGKMIPLTADVTDESILKDSIDISLIPNAACVNGKWNFSTLCIISQRRENEGYYTTKCAQVSHPTLSPLFLTPVTACLCTNNNYFHKLEKNLDGEFHVKCTRTQLSTHFTSLARW